MKKQNKQNKFAYILLTTNTAESNLCSSLEGVNCHIYKQKQQPIWLSQWFIPKQITCLYLQKIISNNITVYLVQASHLWSWIPGCCDKDVVFPNNRRNCNVIYDSMGIMKHIHVTFINNICIKYCQSQQREND